MTPEKIAKLSAEKFYRLYLRRQGYWREWLSIVFTDWNKRFLKMFKCFLPVCIIMFVLLTSSIAGNGTNDAFLMKELIQRVQADLPKALEAYQDIEKLAGGIQRASTKTRLEDDTSFLYAFLFIKYGQQYRIDPTLVAAVAHEESEFNPRAVSTAKAKGLMQVHQPTWRLSDKDLFDPEKNIQMGAKILFIMRNSDPKNFLQRYVGAKENVSEGERYARSVKAKQQTIAKLSKNQEPKRQN